MRLAKKLEFVLLVVVITLTATYLVVRVHGAVESRTALRAFHVTKHSTAEGNHSSSSSLPPEHFSRWSQNRIATYRKLIGTQFAMPLAVLSVLRLRLKVPVFSGVDEVTLNRGVGQIPGTTRVGASGNLGIAGHRDGFFRVLKDISIGDTVELELPNGKGTYTVTSFEIVSPEDVSVLAPRVRPAITLVTCYPFYFVGDALQRFIVHAEESSSDFFSAHRKTPSWAVTRTERQESNK